MKNRTININNSVIKKLISFLGTTLKTTYKTHMLNNYLKRHLNSKNKGMVLIWEMGGFPSIMSTNAIMSFALNLRGYDTQFLLCDGISEACVQREIDRDDNPTCWRQKCKKCFRLMKTVAREYSLKVVAASDYIDAQTKNNFRDISMRISLQDIVKHKYLGINVGEIAYGSFIRYGKGYPLRILNMHKTAEEVLRKYFFGGLVNTYVADQLISKLKPVAIYSSHGVYIDYAPPMFLGHNKQIPAVSWTSGFKEYNHYYSAMISVDKFIPRQLSNNEWETRKMLSLTDQQNIILDDYMIKRYCNNQSMDISFATKPENAKRARKRLNINNNFLTVCLFTHLLWDALYESTSMIFDDADQWVIESMYKMIEIKDVNWIIKIHPAEHIHKSAYSVADTIKKEFPVLPGHIKVVWSDSETNTMSILNMIDVGITIMGTVGLELPLLGKPIIIAGKSHLSNKGFTIDSSTKEEYFNNLSKAKNLKRLTADQINLARLYAYSYFIQQQVPLNVIDKKKGHWGGMDMNKYEELLPGINLIMDEICHSIINGKNVILTEETLRSINYGR